MKNIPKIHAWAWNQNPQSRKLQRLLSEIKPCQDQTAVIDTADFDSERMRRLLANIRKKGD